MPKAHQTKDKLRELLLGQLEKIQKGGCEDWLLEAVVITLRLSQVCAYENTSATACAHVAVFVGFKDWKSRLKCEPK